MYDYQLTDLGLPSTRQFNGTVLVNKWDRAKYVTGLTQTQLVVFLELLEEEIRDSVRQTVEEQASYNEDFPYSLSQVTHFSESPDGRDIDGNIYGIVKDKDKGYLVIAVTPAPIGQLEYSAETLNWQLVKPYKWGWPGIQPSDTLEVCMDKAYPCTHPSLEKLSKWNPNWNCGVGVSPIICSKIARAYTRLKEWEVEVYPVRGRFRPSPDGSYSNWGDDSIGGIAWIDEESETLNHIGAHDFSLSLNSADAKYVISRFERH